MKYCTPWLRSILTTLVLLISGIAISGNSVAADFRLIDPQGKLASLDAFREDGKWTLFLLRYHACAPCDTAELALQQWFSEQDKNKVSVLVLNVDEADMQDRVVKRLKDNGIDYPNFFTQDNAQATKSFREVTGGPLRGFPVWLFFANDGAFIDSKLGPRFDWEVTDEMIQAESSGSPLFRPSTRTAADKPRETPVKTRSADDIHSDGMVRHVISAMVRGDMIRAESWLASSLEKTPDHAALLVEQVRYLMLNEREPANSPLGYRFATSTESRMQEALDTVLDVDRKHPTALYLQAELLITQGRLTEAEQAVQLAEELYVDARYTAYIKSLLLIMQEKPAEAVAAFDLLVNSSFRGPDQTFMFQQAWAQLKSLAIKHPQVDPLMLARDGLVERVESAELLDEIKQRSKSDKPLMVIATSEDPNCGYCVDNGVDLDPFVRKNKDKYNFIYTSVEPWANINYQKWALVVPKVKGLPVGMLFARSQFMISGGLPINEKQQAWYEENYHVFVTENPGELKYKPREVNADLTIALRYFNKTKGEISAFSQVRTDDNFAWGSSSNQGLTQQQANQRAMDLCTRYAREKGIKKPCELYVEKAK